MTILVHSPFQLNFRKLQPNTSGRVKFKLDVTKPLIPFDGFSALANVR